MTFDGSAISSGEIAKKEWTLTLTVTDEAGNSAKANISLVFEVVFPNLTVDKPEVNIFDWGKVEITDSLLLIDGVKVASWSDKYTDVCMVSVMLNDKEVKSGDIVSETGILTLTVTNNQGKSSTAEITLTNDAIYGLENLKNASIQVDKEIDLLEWITFADGVELAKLEVDIDGEKIEVEPSHYTPNYPWTINVIFTLKWKNWNTAEVRVDNLTIKPLNYTTPSIESANPIKDYFSRYNNLTPKTKEFIYHHLLTSYLCIDRYKQDNLEYILAWELPASFECENVGNPNSEPWGHADQWYANLKHLAPNSTIKACSGNWQYLEDYINQHPDKNFMVSCADDALWWNTIEDLKDNPTYSTLKRILWKENIIVSCALGNWFYPWMKTIEENATFQEWWMYKSASVTSNKNNKIAVVWYNPNQQNVLWDDNQSCIPVWFWKWNIVVPFIPLVSWKSEKDLTGNTNSSYPTAAESGSLWNFLSIIMHTHPWTTLENAMTIMIDNYLREETFKYKNDEGDIVDGDKWYFFDTAKFLDNEILHKSDINAIQLNLDDVELPNLVGIIYEGVGIQFEYDGKRYDVTDTAHLNTALTSGSPLRWFWNKDRFRKYGGTDSVTITAQYVDTQGRTVPDVKLSVTKNVSVQAGE